MTKLKEVNDIFRTGLIMNKRPLFVPYVYEAEPYSLIGKSVSLEEFISGAPINLKPTLDDSPFF